MTMESRCPVPSTGRRTALAVDKAGPVSCCPMPGRKRKASCKKIRRGRKNAQTKAIINAASLTTKVRGRGYEDLPPVLGASSSGPWQKRHLAHCGSRKGNPRCAGLLSLPFPKNKSKNVFRGLRPPTTLFPFPKSERHFTLFSCSCFCSCFCSHFAQPQKQEQQQKQKPPLLGGEWAHEGLGAFASFPRVCGGANAFLSLRALL
jgi:hypothetical protein